MLLLETGVPKARQEDDDVHRVFAAVGVVGVVATDGVGGRVVVCERVRCEACSGRGMGHTGETAVALVTR